MNLLLLSHVTRGPLHRRRTLQTHLIEQNRLGSKACKMEMMQKLWENFRSSSNLFGAVATANSLN